jgi:hypothetical protein
MLLRAGAEVNALNQVTNLASVLLVRAKAPSHTLHLCCCMKEGESALIIAARHGHAEVAQMLIAAGAYKTTVSKVSTSAAVRVSSRALVGQPVSDPVCVYLVDAVERSERSATGYCVWPWAYSGFAVGHGRQCIASTWSSSGAFSQRLTEASRPSVG